VGTYVEGPPISNPPPKIHLNQKACEYDSIVERGKERTTTTGSLEPGFASLGFTTFMVKPHRMAQLGPEGGNISLTIFV
jgi:hypothetical protein